MEKTKKQQVLDILESDIIELGRAVSPATFYLDSPPVHQEIVNIFHNPALKQANIIAPRGIAKTSIATMAVIHHLKFPAKGRKLVVIVSKTQAHSKSIISTLKNILDHSAGYRRYFGYQGSQVARVWREDKIVLNDGNAIVARGTGQPIRGINEQLQRPTLIIVDDPEDENNTKTVEAMQANLNWILQACVPSLDSHRGRVVVIGTPLHERCIVMMLKEMKDWHTVHFGNDVENGIALWEDSRSLEWLKTKRASLKDVGLIRMYYQEYECKLIPGEDAMFKKEDFRYYPEDTRVEHNEDDAYLVFPNGERKPVNIYMGIDPASTVSQTADYSTIVPVAMTADNDVFVLDYLRKRLNPMHLADAIERYFNMYKPRLSTIESTGYQEMLRQYLRNRIFIPGLEIQERPRDSKSNRLEMLQPYFAQHKMHLKRSMTTLFDELILFPKAKHDDILDGLYYACKRMRPPSHFIEKPKDKLPEHLQVIVDYYGTQEEEDQLPTYYDPFA